MNQRDILREMIRYMKYMYDLSMKSMQMMYDHADKVLEFIISQGDAAQDESRKYLTEWIANAKKIRDDYIRMMSDSFQKMEEYFKKE